MSAIYLRKKIESETLHLPELKPLIGKNVEIIVREEKETAAVESESPYDAFLALAGTDAVDPDAYKQLRNASHL